MNMGGHEAIRDNLRIMGGGRVAKQLKIFFPSALDVQLKSTVVEPSDDVK